MPLVMAATQTSRGYDILLAIAESPSSVPKAVVTSNPHDIIRELVGMIGAIALVAASTFVWVQSGANADVRSGYDATTTSVAPVS